MQDLEQVYSNQYGGRNLRVTLEMNMSGDELQRARLLVDQGGRLTPYQELDFATRGVGTDEDRLRQSLQGRTRAEIQQIREEWQRNHPGENFDNFLRGELSGREEFEIMDTVEYGAPESASERADQLRRQMDHELNHGAPLGGSVATDEAAYLRGEMARLNETTRELTQTGLTPDEREQLLFRFNVQASVVDEAVQDHQRAVDRVTDLATQIVGMTVAIVVGTVLTVVSGGALGPVAIALIASAASTISTMATKFALKGSDYGIEEIGTDLAVGAVDALASAATAGVGKAIVGRFVRTAGGAATATASAAASAATRTAAASGGNRISQALGRLATRFARSGIGSRINQLPGVNRLGQAAGRFARSQEGVLARVVRGGARETAEQAALRAANERAMSTSTRIFAEIMEESLDNVIQSAPSAFTASVLDDNNWHGNVLLNIVSSTGQQVGQGALMSSAMLGGRLAGRGVRAGFGAAGERWRLRTPEGRIAEGSRRMGSAYLEWVADNPAGSYHDFLNSSTGQSIHRDLAARNMLPTPADLDRLPQTRVPGDTAPQPRLVEGQHPAPPPEPHLAPGEGGPASAARAADAEARVRAADADTAPAPRAAEVEGGTPGRQAGAPDESRAGPRSGDPQAEALAAGLPRRMRERVPVDVNPDLPGNEVRVVPVREDGRVVGVRIEAGPHATPTDVMLHAHVVQGYERYIGLLGRARELIERFNAWFNLQEHAGVGTAAFEARLEILKLPGVIEERMARLSQGGLDPAAQARLLDEVNSLARQIETHRSRLNDFTQGRGYVAAEGREPGRNAAEEGEQAEPTASQPPRGKPEARSRRQGDVPQEPRRARPAGVTEQPGAPTSVRAPAKSAAAALPGWAGELVNPRSPYYNPEAVGRIQRLVERARALDIEVDAEQLAEALASFRGRGRAAGRIDDVLARLESDFDELAWRRRLGEAQDEFRRQLPSADTDEAAAQQVREAIGVGDEIGFGGRPVVRTGVGDEIQSSRNVLRKGMSDASPPPPWAVENRDWNAHHVIPWEHQHHPVFDILRANGGWDHNTPANGIALPTRAGIPGAENLPVHQLPGPGRGHPVYNDRVRGRLNDLLQHYGSNPVELRRQVMRLLGELHGDLEIGGYRGYVF